MPSCMSGSDNSIEQRPQPSIRAVSRPLRTDQNSAGRYPLISRPMQISTRIGVVQAIVSSLEFCSATNVERGVPRRKDLKVDVIVTSATAVPTLKQATAIIPIVFPLGPDPLGGGLVASLAQQGGNVTIQSTDLAAKRLEFLREVVPGLRLLAIIVNVDNPASMVEMREVSAVARTLGLQVDTMELRRAEDIAPAFAALKVRADALYVVVDAFAFANRTRILSFALSARLPTIFNNRNWVQSGGLMSYGANFSAQFQRAAELVDKILRGTKPSDIPVEQPTKFEFVINLTTAKALGLNIPEAFLLRADEVIE